jgi:crotonobetainyl-CoA:carnitine CoA-transferase CaiB-like acyl-CoA transferase
MPQKIESPPDLPLAGIRVIDAGQFIAGPVCGALLADLGADVIRIERPRGNADRYVTPLDKSMPDVGAMFAFANRNKRSLAVDIGSDAAREIIDRLVASADVFVTNMPQRTLEKLRFDLPELRKVNPRIILSNITAYGSEGSWVQRSTTGSGKKVETSLLASSMMMMNSVLAEEAVLRPNRVGIGNRAQTGGPADVFETKDGKIILQVLGNPKFAVLCKLIGQDELISDARFATDNLRGDNAEALNRYVQDWCADLSSAECVDRLNDAGLCAGPVLSPLESLEHPQIRGHSSLHRVAYESAGIEVPLFLPISADGEPLPPASPAPRLGRDSRAVMEELGYSSAEIDAFTASGIIAEAGCG